MASTHRGEDDMAIAAHYKKLRDNWPNILTILVPRHAGGAAKKLRARSREFRCSLRAALALTDITPDTHRYLADTMGELGPVLSPLPHRMHRRHFHAWWAGIIRLKRRSWIIAVIFGPYMNNFGEMAREFVHA